MLDLETRTATEIVDSIHAACRDPLAMREAKIRVITSLFKQLAAMEKRLSALEKIVDPTTVIDGGTF